MSGWVIGSEKQAQSTRKLGTQCPEQDVGRFYKLEVE